jgi:hypothetical protein
VYQAGRIFYFDPFHFKNGDTKPKYFLVLKEMDGQVILACLPSSKVHLPAAQPLPHGCLDQPENGINCYIIEANRPITQNNWSFPQTTFLYGMWLDDFLISQLESRYSIAGVDYEIIGDLLPDELDHILNCFRNSAQVKRKYKRWLNGS